MNEHEQDGAPIEQVDAKNVRATLTSWAEQAKKNAGLIMLLGGVSVIAGILSLAAPMVSGLAIAVVVGFALAFGGIARVVCAFCADSFGQGTLAFIGGALGLVVGVVMVARPGFALATLTLMLGAYLLVDGIFGAVLAFRVRPEKGWGWMLFSAAMSVLLGFLLLRDWPLTGTWAIGTLVGINLMFAGFSMFSIGSAVRRTAKAAA